MKDRDHIEDFFKKHLDVEAEGSFTDDWSLMEKKLDAVGEFTSPGPTGMSTGKVIVISAVIGVVAFLLGWYTRPQVSQTISENVPKQVIDNQATTGSNQLEEAQVQNLSGFEESNKPEEINTSTAVRESVLVEDAGANDSFSEKTSSAVVATVNEQTESGTLADSEAITSNTPLIVNDLEYKSHLIQNKSGSIGYNSRIPSSMEKLAPFATEGQSSWLNRFYVGLAYAPDLNSSGWDKPRMVSSKLGLRVIYQPINRLSLSTGVFYNKKKYGVAGEEYSPPYGYWDNYTNGEVPSWIDASCSVIDIPISLNYHQPLGQRVSILGSVGVSHFTLLDEEYYYEFVNSNPYSNASSEWTTTENTVEGFVALNSSLGIDYVLQNQNVIRMEAYIQAPIETIGWGNVNLYGSGVMISYLVPFKFN